MIKPKILFIDWSGTLSRSKFWGHLEYSSSKNKILFNKIENYLFKTNSNLIKPWMRAEINSEGVIDLISKELNIEYDLIFKQFVKGCKLMEFVSPDVPVLVKKIKDKGIKVFIASNNMDSFDRWTIPAMKLDSLFDGIVNSFNTRSLKQDFDNNGKSMFFDYILKSQGVKAEETILIDDSEDKENLLSNYGINYHQISESNTLIDELNHIYN